MQTRENRLGGAATAGPAAGFAAGFAVDRGRGAPAPDFSPRDMGVTYFFSFFVCFCFSLFLAKRV